MITIPSLNDVSDIADSDVVMITNSQGESFKLAGSEINKRGKIIIASGTTVTGAPLKTGSSVRIYFTADLTAANASTTLQLNYNGVNYYVKAPKNGALVNFVATNLGGTPTVYKYLQAYTTLELLFDGTQFVIIGNPVILSSADYTIYADGSNKGVYKVVNQEVTTGSTYGEFRINHLLNCSKQPVALVIKEDVTPYFFTINAHHTVSGKYVGTTFIVLKEDGTRAKNVTINVSVLFATS